MLPGPPPYVGQPRYSESAGARFCAWRLTRSARETTMKVLTAGRVASTTLGCYPARWPPEQLVTPTVVIPCGVARETGGRRDEDLAIGGADPVIPSGCSCGPGAGKHRHQSLLLPKAAGAHSVAA